MERKRHLRSLFGPHVVAGLILHTISRMISGRPTGREWRAAIAASVAIVALASLPYLAAYAAPAAGYRFGGLLFNPIDGNSYLAKMEIGRRGAWLFKLPYTAEPGDGAPIFFFYILLGHLASWTGASNVLVYHAARVLAGLAFLVVLFAFVSRFFERRNARWIAWLLIAVGSGFGWLAAAIGGQTSDLWVSEAIIFLSLLTNPHFLLGSALMLALYLWLAPGLAPARLTWKRAAPIALATTALAHMHPFLLVPILAILPAAHVAVAYFGGDNTTPLLSFLARLRPALPGLVLFAALSLSWLLLDLWLTNTQPVLAGWTAQNVTPSPPLWDYLVTFGPALALAVPGAWQAARRRTARDLFLLAWLGVNLLLLYAPVALQRRFVQGLSIPIGLLAVEGLYGLTFLGSGVRRVGIVALLFTFALPTNLLVMAAAVQGAQAHHRLLYLTEAEGRALDWLDANTPADALVLASPDLGLFIPAHTARRVLYGHPFETVNAAVQEQAVTSFYANELPDARAFLADNNVGYVLVGPREVALGPGPKPESAGLSPVFTDDGVTVYQVDR